MTSVFITSNCGEISGCSYKFNIFKPRWQTPRSCCNEWHFDRLLKHVAKSIIQLYLQNMRL
jgi:hypothetical protein